MSFFLYYAVAFPAVWVIERVFFRVRFVNKKAAKKLGRPCFYYGNHIGFIDAFTPNLISFPRKNMIIVSAETVSIKGLRTIVQWLGAIPTPSDLSGIRNFTKAIRESAKTKNITIYPEAHIWPYYTGVRDFPDASFSYPIEANAPVIAFFTAFSEPKGFLSCFRKANITVYVSDPIYPDTSLLPREARRDLRDKVYAFMKDCSEKHSTYQAIEYIKN
jgi:1-acyl-sn-glycerol-3-phosphate acyltransferase